jgi:hypothetical protein
MDVLILERLRRWPFSAPEGSNSYFRTQMILVKDTLYTLLHGGRSVVTEYSRNVTIREMSLPSSLQISAQSLARTVERVWVELEWGCGRF